MILGGHPLPEKTKKDPIISQKMLCDVTPSLKYYWIRDLIRNRVIDTKGKPVIRGLVIFGKTKK
jgi:hypothetical protein